MRRKWYKIYGIWNWAERFEDRLNAIEVENEIGPAPRQKKKKLIKKKHTCSDNEEGRKSQRHLSYNRGALSD